MKLKIDYEYVISYIGFMTSDVKASERVDLKEIYLNPSGDETLLTDKIFHISPNTAIPFKVKFKSNINELSRFIKDEIKKENPDNEGIGANVLIKSIKFSLEINYLNPQKNIAESSKAELIKKNLRIGFIL